MATLLTCSKFFSWPVSICPWAFLGFLWPDVLLIGRVELPPVIRVTENCHKKQITWIGQTFKMCIFLRLDKDLKVIIPTEIWDTPETTPTPIERVFKKTRLIIHHCLFLLRKSKRMNGVERQRCPCDNCPFVYSFLRKMISKQRGTFKMLFWVVFKSLNKRSNRRALFSCQVLQTINTKLERFMCWLMETCAKTYTRLYMPSYYIYRLVASQNLV